MWRPQSFADVQAAIGFLEESSRLDFKSALSGGTEIAKDIASMTLEGGVLLYGVDEQGTTVAAALTPIPVAGVRERIQQIADSAISPQPGILIETLTASPTDTTGVVVVEIPPSPLAPHMANDRYPARSGTTTRYLSDSEVERLHLQRRAFTESSASRRPLASYTPPLGGFDATSGLGGVGTLRVVVQALAPIRHPLGARVGRELEAATRHASQTLDGLLKAHVSSKLIDHIRNEWETRGTIGWSAGWASRELSELDSATSGAAVYTHEGTFSFESSIGLTVSGTKLAYEHVWTTEAIAALAIAGAFLRTVPGVSFVHADVYLANLDGAVRAPDPMRRIPSTPRPIADANYIETGTFPVTQLASEPHTVASELLDRLFTSFVDANEDVIDELLD